MQPNVLDVRKQNEAIVKLKGILKDQLERLRLEEAILVSRSKR